MDQNYILSLALRFVVAGSVIVGISIAAEKLKNPVLAGVLLMLPSLSILTFYFIGRSGGMAAVSELALSALLTLPIWVAYAASFYIMLQNGFGLVPSIVYSMLIFIAGSLIYLFARGKLF